MKNNILALDLGKGSLGLAISRSGRFITPLANIRFHMLDFDECESLFLNIIKNENVETIVIGYPLFPSGDPCEITPLVEQFIKRLERLFPKAEIIKVDERGSTVDASELLHNNNISSKKQKKNIDSVAASIILERYLKSINQY